LLTFLIFLSNLETFQAGNFLEFAASTGLIFDARVTVFGGPQDGIEVFRMGRSVYDLAVRSRDGSIVRICGGRMDCDELARECFFVLADEELLADSNFQEILLIVCRTICRFERLSIETQRRFFQIPARRL
jgi:hypothetical protein